MRKSKKKTKKRNPGRSQKRAPSASENVAYYFLAAIGLLLVVLVVIGVLQYMGVF